GDGQWTLVSADQLVCRHRRPADGGHGEFRIAQPLCQMQLPLRAGHDDFRRLPPAAFSAHNPEARRASGPPGQCDPAAAGRGSEGRAGVLELDLCNKRAADQPGGELAMRRRRHRYLEIFSLSFLDLVSCGFGAVVLLILISKPGEGEFSGGIDEAREIMGQITRAERLISDLDERIAVIEGEKAGSRALIGQMQNTIEQLEEEKSSAAQAEAKARDDLEGLVLVEESLNRASIRPNTVPEKRDDE